ncbi:hypothetical protein HOL24_05980 [bacterium]|nr:hypothetical protein [bacterium]
MKNIILIDMGCQLIETVSKMEDINAEVVLIGGLPGNFGYKNINIDIGKFKEFYLCRGYDKDLDFYFNLNNQKLDLTYEEIEQFRHLQLKVEHFFSRTIGDINCIQNKYYHALSYWLNIFKNKKIDYVIASNIYHGELEEMVVSIAKYFNVQVLMIEIFSSMNIHYRFYGVLNWNAKEYISLRDYRGSLSEISQNDIFFKDRNKIEKNNDKYKTIIHKTINTLGGSVLTFLILKMLGKYNVLFLGSKIPFRVYLSGYFHVKSIIKYYHKNSTKKIKNEKYLYYSLHFDPEAVTQARACISSQLTLVKMLSDSVPDDIFIYVKEHPDYTMLNSNELSFHLTNIKNFRSKVYYDEMLKMKNVRLININESSEDLVRDSLAVCSITGSVVLENISKYKKPILMFDSKLSPMGMIKDIFKIRSTDDCKNALKQICNGFTPDYNDFDEILREYTFKTGVEARDFMSEKDLKCLLEKIDKNPINNIKKI